MFYARELLVSDTFLAQEIIFQNILTTVEAKMFRVAILPDRSNVTACLVIGRISTKNNVKRNLLKLIKNFKFYDFGHPSHSWNKNDLECKDVNECDDSPCLGIGVNTVTLIRNNSEGSVQ